MSIWKDQYEEHELTKYEFEEWLASLEGEGTDEEKYNREIGEQLDKEAEDREGFPYPSWMMN